MNENACLRIPNFENYCALDFQAYRSAVGSFLSRPNELQLRKKKKAKPERNKPRSRGTAASFVLFASFAYECGPRAAFSK